MSSQSDDSKRRRKEARFIDIKLGAFEPAGVVVPKALSFHEGKNVYF